jgi:F0F1-type ATP synthase assembly protein I
MTKKKEIGVLASAKEDTLNQIITAQKEKIEALTAYGKKLKKQIKEINEDQAVVCEDIEESYRNELLEQERIHQKVLILGIIGGILTGVMIGMII